MGTFMDAIMLILFVLFMIFIQRGYHHNKAGEREEQRKKDELAQEQSKKL